MNRRLQWVAIESLRLPGDWKARLASEHVRQLADSGAILQPPAIRVDDRSVIWGGDRLAAVHKRGATEAEVWAIDCTEDEAEEMRLVENLHRRADNRDALKAALVKLTMARVEARAVTPVEVRGELPPAVSGNPPPRRPGRPKTAKGIAREEVAKAAGTTPEAIRKAEQRAEAGARQAEAPEPVTPLADTVAPPPGADIAAALDAIDKLLVQATGLVTKLAKEFPELVERFPLQATKYQLQREVAPAFRGMRPEATCDYCKLVPFELPNCGACKGSGWLTADQMADIPVELRDHGPGAGIYREGRFVTLESLRAKKESNARFGRNPTKRAKVVLVDEAGGERDWDDAWTEPGK